MTAVLAWLTSPLWGTASYLEVGWLLLTLGCLAYLKGHLCDALAQARVAEDEIERRAAVADVWAEVKEVVTQGCFGLIGLYAALTPASPIDPGRVLGTVVVTALFVTVQLTNLAYSHYRRESRQWITDALRRQHRLPQPTVDPAYAGPLRRSTDPPSHERSPSRGGRR